ncbi:hypothetical protein CASFOL_022817 [Castilleja foliolosa]|uniref:Uncharacterized protein n=1 Tax=Castilleja foliolosa TaxID=1961234 RepID=A0ABD3CTI8_9LAMI
MRLCCSGIQRGSLDTDGAAVKARSLVEARNSGVDGDEKLDLDWVRGWIRTAAQCLSPTQGV